MAKAGKRVEGEYRIYSDYTMKWWGWGHPEVRFHLESTPGVKTFLQQKLGISALKDRPSFDIEKIVLARPALPPHLVSEIEERIPHVISTRHEDRVLHSFGKSYKDLIRIRNLQIPHAPDAVFFPRNEDHVKEILNFCRHHDIAIVPFGGGTSVVSGVEAERGTHPYVVTLDMKHLNSVLQIDTISRTVTVEAGIFGPELEKQLNECGLTLGHFPQSFEFSTLGGWIAARSSGQNSIAYGGIEKNIVSVKMITFDGDISTLPCPRRADGPDLKELVVGSEGILGVIVSATIRVVPLPSRKDYFMVAFPSFSQAARAARDLTQSGIPLAMLRVSDEDESEAMILMGSHPGPKSWVQEAIQKLAKRYLAFRGIFLPRASLVLIGLEGSRGELWHRKKRIRTVLRPYNTVTLGRSPGKRWLKERFFLPYLRDELLDNGVLIDTLETATSWANLSTLYKATKEAILNECLRSVNRGCVMVHISHLYKDGASLYFTVMAPQQPGAELSQWQRMKSAASKAIVAYGGVISHHHGIGVDHKRYLTWNEQERQLVKSMKQVVDPQSLFNPGKLL